MSSSKFANLEGVDFNSPDVYETNSPSPTRRTRNLNQTGRDRGSDSSHEDSDEEGNDDSDTGGGSTRRSAKKVGGQQGVDAQNPDIIGTGLDPEEAAKRFRGATGVDGRQVDFSSVIQRRKKRPQYYPPSTFETTTYALGSGTGYQTSGGGFGPGDEEPWTRIAAVKEQPVDRFRRLRFEMEELERELEAGKTSTAETKKGEESQASEPGEEGVPAGLMMQLSDLRGQLSTLEDRSKQQGSSSSWNVETRKLLERLSGQDGQAHRPEEKGATQVPPQGEGPIGGGAARVAELDRRLAGLEELVGVKDALVDETESLPRPLLPSLARIEHLLTLLTHPRHLDGISRRIKVLVSELERLHEARRKLTMADSQQQQMGERVANGGEQVGSASLAVIPIETMQKLDTVLPMLTKMEPLIPIVPALLARLHSLTALHASSNSFVEDVGALESNMKRSHANSQELKGMLTNLEASFGENQKVVQDNLQVVEQRMESITKRMESLQSSGR